MIGQGEQDGGGFGDDITFGQAQCRYLAAGIDGEKGGRFLLVLLQ